MSGYRMESQSQPFRCEVTRDGELVRITLAGELDLATTPEVEPVLRANGVRQRVLDLRELTFMDSTGLRALAQTNARAGEAGFALSIVRGPRQIERVLEISGLAELLPLVDAPPDVPSDGEAA